MGFLLEEAGVCSPCVGLDGAGCMLWAVGFGHVSGCGWGAEWLLGPDIVCRDSGKRLDSGTSFSATPSRK